MFVADKNHYPESFHGGHKMVSSEASGDDTLEVHEFYNPQGLVVFYWKVKKNSDGDIIEWKLKIPSSPATPAETYVAYDDLT